MSWTRVLVITFVIGCGGPSDPSPDAQVGDATTPMLDSGQLDSGQDGGTERTDGGQLPPIELGDPITVPPDQLESWVWISMPEMRCADGTEGGFAVNMTERSGDLLFYLQGGGICYNSLTCAVGGAARNVGADPINTALDGAIRGGRGVFDREDPTNPLRDMSYVVVPHCTGDFHLGTKMTRYGSTEIHHMGYFNIARAMERVVPTFRDAERVVLSGFSAGGVGITGNYHQVASAFAMVGQPPPYLIADGGPLMRKPFLSDDAQADLRESWGLDDSIGRFCASCMEDGYHDVYRINAVLHSGLRSSVVCAYDDSVVRLLYSVMNGGFNSTQMREGLVDLGVWTETYESSILPGVHRTFYFEGERHGALNVDALSATPGLAEFLQAQLGSGEWSSVRP